MTVDQPAADKPLVSIGLPVHNGEEYLAASIESLLDQTYTHLELIICDNASSDATQAICEKFATADDRVRYHRNERNIGGAKNHNLTFTLSRGKYFRWAAHDDIAEAELIARCVEVLESNPGIAACHTDFVHIDEDGRIIGRFSRNHCASPDAVRRFATMASARDYCEETYALIRSDVFGRTALQQDYTGSDRTLMSEIALYGPFENVPECLFRKRLHDGNEYLDWRTRKAWFGDRYLGRVALPWWEQLVDYRRVIRRVPLTSHQRAGCYAFLGRWMVVNARKLLKDVAMATMMLFHSRSWRARQFSDTRNWA